jgi:Lon protease-like protein
MPSYDSLPVFPLHTVLFPQMLLPLNIFEERYRNLVAHCLASNEPFGVVMIESGSEVDCGGGAPTISRFGTTARIVRAERLADGRYFIEVRGETRFAIEELYDNGSYICARVKPVWEANDDLLDVQRVFDQAGLLFREYMEALAAENRKQISLFQPPQDPGLLSYIIGAILPVTLAEKQSLLEMPTIAQRLQREVEILQMERDARAYATKADASAQTQFKRAPDASKQRTIVPVESSYKQHFFSRN